MLQEGQAIAILAVLHLHDGFDLQIRIVHQLLVIRLHSLVEQCIYNVFELVWPFLLQLVNQEPTCHAKEQN